MFDRTYLEKTQSSHCYLHLQLRKPHSHCCVALGSDESRSMNLREELTGAMGVIDGSRNVALKSSLEGVGVGVYASIEGVASGSAIYHSVPSLLFACR